MVTEAVRKERVVLVQILAFGKGDLRVEDGGLPKEFRSGFTQGFRAAQLHEQCVRRSRGERIEPALLRLTLSLNEQREIVPAYRGGVELLIAARMDQEDDVFDLHRTSETLTRWRTGLTRLWSCPRSPRRYLLC